MTTPGPNRTTTAAKVVLPDASQNSQRRQSMSQAQAPRTGSIVSSTGYTMSTNAEGERVISRRVWTWSKVLRGIRHGRLPIILVLVSFTTVLSLATALFAWGWTNRAANNAAQTVVHALELQIVVRMVEGIDAALAQTEETVDNFARDFETGVARLNPTASDPLGVQELNQRLLNALIAKNGAGDGWFSSLNFVLDDGHYVGVSRTVDGGYSEYRHDENYVFTEWEIDERLNTIGTDPIVNSGVVDYSTAYWVKGLDLNDPNARHWAEIEVSGGTGWKTYARAVHDANGYVGTLAADLSLSFLNRLLMRLSGQVPYKGHLAILGYVAGVPMLVGSTIPSAQLDMYKRDEAGIAVGLYSFAELAEQNHIIRAIYDYVEVVCPRDQIGLCPEDRADPVNLEDGVYQIMIKQLRREARGIRWQVVGLLENEGVMGPVREANRATIGIVMAIVAAGCVVATVFAFSLARALHRITRDLILLSNFKFQDVLQADVDKESGVKRPNFSRIAELWTIQKAFHKMVIQFASAVQQNRKFSERRRTLSAVQAQPVSEHQSETENAGRKPQRSVAMNSEVAEDLDSESSGNKTSVVGTVPRDE
ncbi:hypothetical protein HDU85_004318 [Gaertneriomyces sp. JEL0708]|nr:hypothetical protein HDU85_004318 [Gaertneriomyces sp. JEL0708]